MRSIEIIALVSIRVLALAFLVFAGWSIPDTLEMKRTTATIDKHGTLLFPIEACIPSSIQITIDGDETFIKIPTEDLKCHTLRYLVNACVVALFFSMVAVVFHYAICDLSARFHVGPLTRSAVTGMSLLLIFMLLQTSFSCWALSSEIKFWNQLGDVVFNSNPSYFQDVGIEAIQVYGSRNKLIATGGAAVVFAVLVLIDGIMVLCWTSSSKTDDTGGIDKSSVSTSNSALPMTNGDIQMSTRRAPAAYEPDFVTYH